MIGSLLSRISDAEKLTPQQLQQTVKNKVLPAGIASMISQDDATKQKSAPAQPPQGTVVSKIMEEADKALSPEDKIMQKINLIKQDIGEIQEGVQSGEIKAYEGIPIIKEKVAELGKLQAMLLPPPQMPQIPPPPQMAPVQPQGIDSAESNLPTEMAEGGIVGFANGGVTGGGEMQLTVPISIGGESSGPYTGFGGGGIGGGGGGYAPPGGPQGGSAGSLASLGRGAQQMQPPGAVPQAAQGAQMNMQENAQSAQGASADVNGFTPIQTNQGTLLAGQFLQGLSGIPQDQKAGGAMGSQYGMQQGQGAPYQNVSDSIGPNFQGFAKGGPVGYARGVLIDDDEDDEDYAEGYTMANKLFARDPTQQRRESASMMGLSDSIGPRISAFTQPISDFASGIKNKFINKTPEIEPVVNPPVQQEAGIPGIIASKAQKYNLPPQLMTNIAKAESNFNPNAGNKTGSSAKGLYQFIDKTWTGMGGKPGEQFDPEINSELGAKYIRQNAEFLKNKLGRDPSYSEVYAAHYFGPSGASNLLTRANPKDSIEKGLRTFNDPKGVRLIMKQNPNLKGKTVGQVLNDLETKTGQGIVSLAAGGQIKHFVGGNVVTDDYRSNYDRIFGNKNVTPSGKPITAEEVKANIEKLKALRAEQEAKGLRAPVAPPSARTTSLGGGITEVFNALRGGQSNVPKAVLGSGDRNTYPGMSDLNYYNELLAKSKEDPTYTPYQDEMKKLLARNPDLLKNNTVTPDLIGPLANAAKPSPLLNVPPAAPVKAPVNANAAIIPPTAATDTSYLGDDTNTEIGGLMTPFTPKAEEKEPAAQDKEKATYSFEDYLKDQQAQREGIRGKKDEDRYMSLLAAGLGMMSGTSPYAAANIGKGALAGVQDYRDTQKQRAAELASIDKNMLGAYRYGSLDKYYTSLGLSKDEKDKLAKETLEEKRFTREDLNKRYSMGILQKMDEGAKNKAIADAKLSPMQLQTMSPEAIAAITAAGAQKYLNTPQYRKLYRETYGMDPFEDSNIGQGNPNIDLNKYLKKG
jgi:hypothetical protein